MRIAAVSDDGKTISEHFGRAAYYVVLEVREGEIHAQERREKPGTIRSNTTISTITLIQPAKVTGWVQERNHAMKR